MDDLSRSVWKGEAVATCQRCQFCVEGVWPEQASKRARKHTRETGHTTEVGHDQKIEYRREVSQP